MWLDISWLNFDVVYVSFVLIVFLANWDRTSMNPTSSPQKMIHLFQFSSVQYFCIVESLQQKLHLR